MRERNKRKSRRWQLADDLRFAPRERREDPSEAGKLLGGRLGQLFNAEIQNSKTYKRELALKKKLIEKGLIGKRWDEHRDDVLDFDESEGLSEKTIRTIFNGEDSDESDTEFPKAPPKKAGIFE